MTKATQKNNVLNAFEEGSERLAEGFKTVGKIEIPEAARNFVKRAAAVAKDRIEGAHRDAEMATSAAEGALNRSVGWIASLVRGAESALYQDAEAFVAGVHQLASAGSLAEAFEIQSHYLVARSDVAVARAKSLAGYFSKPFSKGADSVQESLANAA